MFKSIFKILFLFNASILIAGVYIFIQNIVNEGNVGDLIMLGLLIIGLSFQVFINYILVKRGFKANNLS